MFKKSYIMLRAVSVIFRVAGWLSPILGLISGILIFSGAKLPNYKITSITAIALGVIYFLIFHVIADFIRAFLSMAEDSKKIVSLLEDQKNNIR